MNRESALRVSVSTGALFRAALLTAAGIIAAATPADAALYYSRDSDPGYYGFVERPQPPPVTERTFSTHWLPTNPKEQKLNSSATKFSTASLPTTCASL